MNNNSNHNRQHRRITYEYEAIRGFSRIAAGYSVGCVVLGLVALFAFRGVFGELVLVVGILTVLIFGLVNYALVLTLLVRFLSELAGIKTPPPPKVKERFIPVHKYGELEGHIVTGGGGVSGGE